MSETSPLRTIAFRVLALGLLAASGALAVSRSGLLAWLGLIVATFLLAKHFRRPAGSDLAIAALCVVVWSAAWGATWAYVRSTWESGEVVELGVTVGDAVRVARVWILDVEGAPVMYYDAPPEVAEALLATAPITIQRGPQRIEGCANAAAVDTLPEDELASLLGEMQEKYRERNRATDVFYVVLGVERDRTGLVLRVQPCP